MPRIFQAPLASFSLTIRLRVLATELYRICTMSKSLHLRGVLGSPPQMPDVSQALPLCAAPGESFYMDRLVASSAKQISVRQVSALLTAGK